MDNVVLLLLSSGLILLGLGIVLRLRNKRFLATGIGLLGTVRALDTPECTRLRLISYRLGETVHTRLFYLDAEVGERVELLVDPKSPRRVAVADDVNFRVHVFEFVILAGVFVTLTGFLRLVASLTQ